jgi:hypothetical protein
MSVRTVLTEDGVGGVPGGLVQGRLADEPLVAGERDAGRREAAALVVGDDLGAIAPTLRHTATQEYVVPRLMPTAGPSPFKAAAISTLRYAKARKSGKWYTTAGRVPVCARIKPDELGLKRRCFFLYCNHPRISEMIEGLLQ